MNGRIRVDCILLKPETVNKLEARPDKDRILARIQHDLQVELQRAVSIEEPIMTERMQLMLYSTVVNLANIVHSMSGDELVGNISATIKFAYWQGFLKGKEEKENKK